MEAKSIRLVWILSITFILLLIPLFAMQLTNDVNWTSSDFMIAAILLAGTGLVSERIFSKVSSRQYKIAAALVLFTLFVLVWAELAVGIFGTPLAGC